MQSKYNEECQSITKNSYRDEKVVRMSSLALVENFFSKKVFKKNEKMCIIVIVSNITKIFDAMLYLLFKIHYISFKIKHKLYVCISRRYKIFGTEFVGIFLSYGQKTGCPKRYFKAFSDTLSCFLGVSGGAFCFKRLIISSI